MREERKHLSADGLFSLLRNKFANVPDHRRDDAGMPLTDVLMLAFARFSLKCPSLLDYDKQRAEDTLKTIYGIQQAPCDSYMREVLDPLSPEWLRPSFTGVFGQLQRGKALEERVFFKDCYLLALNRETEIVHYFRFINEIENETFNTLKNQGYNFTHNYGHGEQNLSVVFATRMMLAFLRALAISYRHRIGAFRARKVRGNAFGDCKF